jgi:hypothetical protein
MIKTCPFCGEAPEKLEEVGGLEWVYHSIGNCLLTGKRFPIHKWNNRMLPKGAVSGFVGRPDAINANGMAFDFRALEERMLRQQAQALTTGMPVVTAAQSPTQLQDTFTIDLETNYADAADTVISFTEAPAAEGEIVRLPNPAFINTDYVRRFNNMQVDTGREIARRHTERVRADAEFRAIFEGEEGF